MSLNDWLKTGALREHKPSGKELKDLLGLADRSLADASVKGLSAEGRYQIAYNACLVCASAALRASGYRTNSNVPGHHAITIQSLEFTVRMNPSLIRRLDIHRRKRNKISYDAPLAVSDKEVQDILKLAAILRRDVQAWVRHNYPNLA